MTNNQIDKAKSNKIFAIIKAAITGIFSGVVKFVLERCLSDS